MPLDLDLLHFEVGDRGQQLRVPVDQPLVLVDQPLAMKLHEHLDDGAREPLVHGEALARPVAGGAQPLELVDDRAARLRLPRPHFFEKLLAPERTPVVLLALHELALDHHLRGNAGMIGAGLPEHVAAAHAFEAGEHVLQRVVERMPHVQRAGHVGRRDDDAIGPWRRAAPAGRNGTRPLPPRRRRCGPRPRRAGRSCRSSLYRSGDFAVKSPPLSVLSTLESLPSLRPSAERESRNP